MLKGPKSDALFIPSRFVVKHTIAKEIQGSWILLSFDEVFCDSMASNQLVFLMVKNNPALQHNEASLIVLKNVEDFVVIPLSIEFPQRLSCDKNIEVLLVDGPALFLFDKKNSEVSYYNIPGCKTSHCCRRNSIRLSCTLEGVKESFFLAFIRLYKTSFNFPHKIYEFVVVKKFLRNESSEIQSGDNKGTVAILRLHLEGVLCDDCLEVKPKDMSLTATDLEFNPANLVDCINFLYPMVTDERNNFRPCGASLPLLIFTDIGQLMYILNGEIRNICDLPQVKSPRIMKCSWKDPLFVLKDRESSTVYIINSNSLKLLKSFSDVISVVVSDLMKSGKSQICLLKKSFLTEEIKSTGEYVLIKDESDLQNEEPKSKKDDEVSMECSGGSAVDLFGSLMDVDEVPATDHPDVKKDVFAMLQNKILMKKIAVRRAEDANANYDAVIKKSAGALRAICSNQQEIPELEDDHALLDLLSVNLDRCTSDE